ncbi:MAG: dipeptide epimerase [Gemmatales bacterium]|nr:dipeptide epimerase [Gemmatales bacterium]MDW8387945.1 dipeptide epimerase [Gemmatales bacterium]
MRVVELVAWQVRIPLRRPIRHASYTRTCSDNLVVACRLEDGTLGYGEGVPREYVTGESIDEALSLLRQTPWPELLGDPQTFADAVQGAERLRLPGTEFDPRGCRGNAARCAVELALLDAYGKHFGRPLSAVTKLLAPDLYQPRKRVRYSTAITSAAGLKAKAAAMLMRLYGFQQCKVKVGIAGQNDVERLRHIRRWIGPKVDLRVDANEAWKPAEVVQRIQELEPFGITSVEQPVAHEDVACLRQVRSVIRTPIMLDESLCSWTDAQRAVAEQTCDLFNLRLSKCGGFIPSLRLAQFARQHGLGYQLGCQVGETALLSAAGRHFACSVRDIRYLEGSYDRRLVRENLSQRDITFGYGGLAPALTGPGLGIALDESALHRVAVRKEVLLG